ncbi:MAG TPA: prepilin-type N-terminal cleavage/methylation domain-containing protein [Thermoanaerobaculia bacterium]|jgi:type II secretion system protein I|nr:prepilin-type N-terminal cleavage/methylation domain-containing protein [Thermoanaerobaculia bacterium]
MPRAGNGGFTLVETLIALAILGIALLLVLSLVLNQPRMLKRLDAQRQAFRAIEGTLEAVRAGVIPLQTTRFENFDFLAGTPAPPDLTLQMDVAPVTAPPDLYKVSLSAHYTVAGKGFDKQVQTLVWQTGGP